jgi:hypothetical protein
MIGPDQYCKCIERKLPNLSTYRSVKPVYMNDISRFPAPEPLLPGEETEEEAFESKLSRYGLADHEIALIVARYSDDMTLVEIVKSQGWTSNGSCSYHLKQVLKKLREREYK